jgi:H+/Cl- antiporter ClcA
VPAGIFLPGILIGCALGRILAIIQSMLIDTSNQIYATVGAAAILGGYTRFSFSLAVIMMETTQNVNLFLPIIFALFTSFGVGRIFKRSIYVGSVRFKNIPFLLENIPKNNMSIVAEQIMTNKVYFLHMTPTVE